MNSFDLFILIPIAAGLIFGFFKGFVREVISLLAVVGAIFVAELFSEKLTPYVAELFSLSSKMAKTGSYIVLFVGTIFIALMLSKVVERIFSGLHLKWLNSLLGGVFGALKIAIVASVVVNTFDALDSKFQFANPKNKATSIVYYPVMKLAPALWKEAKKTIEKNKLEELYEPQHETNDV